MFSKCEQCFLFGLLAFCVITNVLYLHVYIFTVQLECLQWAGTTETEIISFYILQAQEAVLSRRPHQVLEAATSSEILGSTPPTHLQPILSVQNGDSEQF